MKMDHSPTSWLALTLSSALLLSTLGAFAAEEGGAKAAEREEKAQGLPQPLPNPSVAVRPTTPELVGPAFMEKISGTSTLLKWNAVTGATNYHLQVAKDPNFKWLLVDEPRFTGTSFEVKALEGQKHYYWRVFSRNEHQDRGYTTSMPAKSMFETQ